MSVVSIVVLAYSMFMLCDYVVMLIAITTTFIKHTTQNSYTMEKQTTDQQSAQNKPMYVSVILAHPGMDYCMLPKPTLWVTTAMDKTVVTCELLENGLATVQREIVRSGDDEYERRTLDVDEEGLDKLLARIFERIGKPKLSKWKVEVRGHYGTHANGTGDPLCEAVNNVWEFSVDMTPKTDEWDERDKVFPSLSTKKYEKEHACGCGWY